MDLHQFEYKVVVGTVSKVEQLINKLAEQGWEAVSLSATAGGAGASCLMKKARISNDPNAGGD